MPHPGVPGRSNRSRTARALVKLLAATAGVVVIAGGAYTVWGRTSEGGEGAATSPTLEMGRAVKTTFDISTTAAGELQAKNQIEIRNKLEQQSTIIEIVEEGKMVKKGDVLIRLQSDEIKSQVEQEQLQVETARADEISAKEDFEIQVSENDSAFREAKLKFDLAELDLKKWIEGEVKSKRQENRLACERAVRELERLDEKLTQSESLFKQKFLSLDELKKDRLAQVEGVAAKEKADLASQVYEAFEYPRSEKEKNSAVGEAKAALERVQRKNESQLASKKANLENKSRQLSIREDRLKKLLEQMENTTLTAPSDGLVVYATSMNQGFMFGGEGPLQIGRKTYPNELLISLPDTSLMVASVQIPESMASRVRPGMPANIKVEAAGGKSFQGTVASIGVLAESGGWRDPNRREYTVKIDLENIEGSSLKPSMRAEAELRLGRVEEALAVPIQAVFNEGPMRYVYLPQGAKFVRRPVQVGRRSERFAEVTAGLGDNEQVILRQPKAAEVLNKPWDAKELAAVGLKLDEQGKIIALNGGPGGPGGPAKGGKPAGKPVAAAPGGAPGAGGMILNAGAIQLPAGTEIKMADGATVTTTAPATEAKAGDKKDDAKKDDDAKPASKPDDAKPAEAKPAEVKPVESKPVKAKPVETKPG
jgi:HlyD family secretion protein